MESFARAAYREILGRDIDAAALSNVVQALAAGGTRVRILLDLVQSEELFNNVPQQRRRRTWSIEGGPYQAPAWIQVESTSACNLRCSFCPRTAGRFPSSRAPAHFPDELWPEVLRYAPDAGYVMLQGYGEPLCCPTFFERLLALDAIGVAMGFSTNGIGAEKMAEKLGTLNHLLHVNVSLDSLDPEIYRRLRGAELSEALRGLEALVKHLPDTVISTSSVATPETFASLAAFPAMLCKLGVKFFVLQVATPTVAMAPVEAHWQPEAARLLAEFRAQCARYEIALAVSPTLEGEISRQRSDNEPRSDRPVLRQCTTPFDSVYIDSRGLVFPCGCAADSTPPVGDLRTQPLEEIWRSSDLRRFRDQVRSAHPPTVCHTCPAAPVGEHPLSKHKCSIVSLVASSHDHVDIQLKVRNTGITTWDESTPIRVGTTRPRDRVSAGRLPSWTTPTRPCGKREPTVRPGEVATFHFSLAPTCGVEAFQLLIEGQCWLPDSQFFVQCREPSINDAREAAPLSLASLFP